MSDLQNKRIVFYDGYCILCSRLIRFLMKKDKRDLFSFTTLDKIKDYEWIMTLSGNLKLPDSIVYLRNSKMYVYSDAAIQVLIDLGGAWKLVGIFYIIPKGIRDFVYKLIARYRYRIFGKSNSCYLPVQNSDLNS
jgi:predicted DCC family thiol-disulfide oxidoreductase YuxK